MRRHAGIDDASDPFDPSGRVRGLVGVPHGVELDGQELFYAHVHLHSGPAPVRRYLPKLIELCGRRRSIPARSLTSRCPLIRWRRAIAAWTSAADGGTYGTPTWIGDALYSGAAQEQAVVGETPNLASRLQVIAEPNTVVIAESTRKLLGDLFELEDLGAKDLKGIAGQMRAWKDSQTSCDLLDRSSFFAQ